MFASMYSIMAQGRLKVTSPAGGRLVEELKEVERRISDSGQESYAVASGQGHHADCVYACGLALVVAERSVGRQARTIALHPEGHQRKPGRPRQGNTARRVIQARLEQSRLQSEATMWAQIGEPEAFD